MAIMNLSSLTKPPGYVTSTILISLAGWLNGYDTGSIGAVTEMPQYRSTFGHLSPTLHGLTVSMIMLTGVFPSFYAGQLADRIGRLPTITIGALLFCLGAVLQGASFQLGQFIAGRAIGGVGMGTWMSPLAVYVTEIAPSQRRGTLMSVPQLAVTAGICSGYFSAYGTVRLDDSFSWRAIYIVQVLASLGLAAICFFIPESPRWSLLHGRREDAEKQLRRLDFSRVEAEKDLLGPAASRAITSLPGPVEGLTMIFRAQYRSRTALALVMLGMIQMSGIDGILYYAPALFSQAGLPATTASFIASGVSAILMFAITIPALVFADRFSRRSVILSGGLILTACMFLIGSLYAAGAVDPASAARWVVVAAVFVFALTYCATWGIVGKIYASEIQPTATRSSANCVAQGLGFFTNWLVTILTPVLLANSSFSAYFLFGGFCLFSVVLLWAYMPETRGQSLEAIEEAFRAPIVGGSKVARAIRRWFGGGSQGSSAGSEPGSGQGSVISLEAMLSEAPRLESVEMGGMVSEGQTSNASAVEAGVPAVMRMETI